MRRFVPTSLMSLVLQEGRGRVHPTVTEGGCGALEFPDAEGGVVEGLVPERLRDQEK